MKRIEKIFNSYEKSIQHIGHFNAILNIGLDMPGRILCDAAIEIDTPPPDR